MVAWQHSLAYHTLQRIGLQPVELQSKDGVGGSLAYAQNAGWPEWVGQGFNQAPCLKSGPGSAIYLLNLPMPELEVAGHDIMVITTDHEQHPIIWGGGGRLGGDIHTHTCTHISTKAD